MTDKRWLFYSPICTLGTSSFLYKKDGHWTFDIEGWKQHLTPIANAGANAIRVLPFSVFGDEKQERSEQFSPYVLDPATNKWDLDKFDPEYFPIVRQLIKATNECRMTVWFCWFDGCQFYPGPWQKFSPWINNIQKIGSIYANRAGAYLQAFMRRTYDEFKGFDMGWHFANESTDYRFPDFAETYMFPVIKSLGIPFNRLGYGADMELRAYLGGGQYADELFTVQDTVREHFGRYFGEENKVKVLREVHGAGSPGDADRPFGDKVAQAVCWWGQFPVGDFIVDTDGVKDGDSKCDKDFDGARPSAQRMHDMCAYLLGRVTNVRVHVAHCPQTTDSACLAKTFRAISLAYFEKWGKWPANYGNVVYVPPPIPEPIPEPMPEPTPNPVCNCKHWLRKGHDNKRDYFRYIHCLFGGKRKCL